MKKLKEIKNWGNYPRIPAQLMELEFINEISEFIERQSNVTVRGNGRAYGDASLGENIFSTLKLDKFLALDEKQGIITCQAGTIFADILKLIVPKGFFLPVTPGTKFITVGGAIAADVHGKNHHSEGCFSRHLISFQLIGDRGNLITCSREENTELFWTTIGGMGLTGLIYSAVFYLKRIETAYIRQESIKARNLTEVMDLFEASRDWTYTVAWLDCLSHGKNQGRSLLLRGEHATIEELPPHLQKRPLNLPEKRKLDIPFTFPNFVLNGLSVQIFNTLYYHKQWQEKKTSIIDCDRYFYPLDGIENWNRIYGDRGFVQYQFVLPKAQSKAGLEEILNQISTSKKGSFLTVLKLFGQADPDACLSFPMEGYTLALDFKLQPGLFEFLNELDKIVLECGGRLYLVKDARTTAQTLSYYPHLAQFKAQINRKFTSHLAKRIGL
ncbi:MAG: FAD-binding oxidoreductase [Cyanobacteria bacterium SBLK]|nr:FAD-binding oxidoreductase [Cyanobacteria bacterium SBLK]